MGRENRAGPRGLPVVPEADPKCESFIPNAGQRAEMVPGFYAGDYYSRSSPNDSTGPSSGSYRVSRGGFWAYPPVICRSAYRGNLAPAYYGSNFGFRAVPVR